MPNWVYNRLEVLGDPDELAALVAEVQSDRTQDGVEPEVLDFARIVPIPESLEAAASPALQPGDIGEDGAMPAWRQWRVEHWGTKWNAMYARREGDSGGGRVVYRFSTAYSTPEPWLAAISRSYPTLAFVHEYCEEFIHFFGRGHWQAGEIVAEDDVDDPHEFEWLEWQADDDVASRLRSPNPRLDPWMRKQCGPPGRPSSMPSSRRATLSGVATCTRGRPTGSPPSPNRSDRLAAAPG